MNPPHDAEREVMLAVLKAMDEPEHADQLSYVEVLRALQKVLAEWMITAPTRGTDDQPAELSPEADQALRQATAYFDPHNEDHLQDALALLRRLQQTVDLELSRWTSAMVQPAGPSGERAVPEPPPLEPEAAKV